MSKGCIPQITTPPRRRASFADWGPSPKTGLFNDAQLTELYLCVQDTLDDNHGLTDQQTDLLKKIGQIHSTVSHLRERIEQTRWEAPGKRAQSSIYSIKSRRNEAYVPHSPALFVPTEREIMLAYKRSKD